jgi:5-methylcytosine-specific restriction endonuclease McrA
MEWNQCWYCGGRLRRNGDGENLYTVDHVIPQIGPFVAACKKCNNLKGQSSLDDFKEFLGKRLFYGELRGWKPW